MKLSGREGLGDTTAQLVRGNNEKFILSIKHLQQMSCVPMCFGRGTRQLCTHAVVCIGIFLPLFQPTSSHHHVQELVGRLLGEQWSPMEAHGAVVPPATQGVQAAAHLRHAEVTQRPRALRVLKHSR